MIYNRYFIPFLIIPTLILTKWAARPHRTRTWLECYTNNETIWLMVLHWVKLFAVC